MRLFAEPGVLERVFGGRFGRMGLVRGEVGEAGDAGFVELGICGRVAGVGALVGVFEDSGLVRPCVPRMEFHPIDIMAGPLVQSSNL